MTDDVTTWRQLCLKPKNPVLFNHMTRHPPFFSWLGGVLVTCNQIKSLTWRCSFLWLRSSALLDTKVLAFVSGQGKGTGRRGLWAGILPGKCVASGILDGRVQYEITNHHTKSECEEKAKECDEGWTGEECEATGSWDLGEASRTASDKPYRAVPSSQSLTAAVRPGEAGGSASPPPANAHAPWFRGRRLAQESRTPPASQRGSWGLGWPH